MSQNQNQEPKKVRMVKLVAKTALVRTTRNEAGHVVETPIALNEEFEVPESEVKDWTTPMVGQHNFVGERYNVNDTSDRNRTVKAELAKSGASAPA